MTNYSLYGNKLLLCWGTCPTDLFGTLDVNQTYVSLGGTISPQTQVKFSSVFPSETYKKTALTDHMRKKYQCAGSLTAEIFEPNKSSDYVSLSDYYDLTMHDKNFGDHHNIYLQHKIGNQKIDHTDKFCNQKNRHVKLDQQLYFVAMMDGKILFQDCVKASVKK